MLNQIGNIIIDNYHFCWLIRFITCCLPGAPYSWLGSYTQVHISLGLWLQPTHYLLINTYINTPIVCVCLCVSTLLRYCISKKMSGCGWIEYPKTSQDVSVRLSKGHISAMALDVKVIDVLFGTVCCLETNQTPWHGQLDTNVISDSPHSDTEGGMQIKVL